MPVGLFRDGKKRKRRAAARARAAEAGQHYEDRRARPDPLMTSTGYIAAPAEGRARETEDYVSAVPQPSERY